MPYDIFPTGLREDIDSIKLTHGPDTYGVIGFFKNSIACQGGS